MWAGNDRRSVARKEADRRVPIHVHSRSGAIAATPAPALPRALPRRAIASGRAAIADDVVAAEVPKAASADPFRRQASAPRLLSQSRPRVAGGRVVAGGGGAGVSAAGGAGVAARRSLRLRDRFGRRFDSLGPVQPQVTGGALGESFAAHAVTIGVLRLVVDRRADVDAADDLPFRDTDQSIDVTVARAFFTATTRAILRVTAINAEPSSCGAGAKPRGAAEVFGTGDRCERKYA